MTLEERVLARVVPSQEEERRLRATVEDVRRRVAEGLRTRRLEAEPLLVGSVAKGTHLSQAEIDVFVRFPRDTPREALERVGLELGEFLTDKVRMYAEHPFTRGRWNGFEVEVVPCYHITDARQKMSAVDRTPLHARYVIGKLRPKQREEVRLLKAFCEGVGVYGAEAKVQGFSGYLCELLVLKYGTFRAVLEASQRWRRGEVLELDEAAARSFPEPLVLVDPIDAGRNVASAVGEGSLATFVYGARAFIARPREAFFFPKPRRPLTAAQAKRLLGARRTTLLGVELPLPKVTDDILYPQIRKAQRAIQELCRKAGFRIATSRFAVAGGNVLLLFEFQVYALPRAEKHLGPPAWVRDAEDFLRRWRGARRALTPPYLEEGRWAVDVVRGHTDASKLIRARVRELGLGSHLDRAVRRMRLLTGARVLKAAYLPEVTQLLRPRFPWE